MTTSRSLATRPFTLGAVAYDPKVVTIWEGFKDWFAGHGFAFDYVLFSGYERVLLNGTTNHGAQSVDPALKCEPLTYYSREGPIGQLFTMLKAEGRLGRVGRPVDQDQVVHVGPGRAELPAEVPRRPRDQDDADAVVLVIVVLIELVLGLLVVL